MLVEKEPPDRVGRRAIRAGRQLSLKNLAIRPLAMF